MKLRTIAIAIAALSFAATASAMGDKDSSAAITGGQQHSADRSTSSSMRSNDTTRSASSTIRAGQQSLKDKGYDVGSANGEMNAHTERALRQFQQAHGLPETGAFDAQTLGALGVQGAAAPSAGASTEPSEAARSYTRPPGTTSGMASPSSTNRMRQ